ncbi:hypothetical protein [Hymenobacter weizhouensis]|uniref:hypothetical protein n=1 Tax=Hymenobacter sp. YIM 151500-1 TaxID=2987689 RepID=UPI002227683C|nr:hypothetical protein [Hymenobacter sp. YIM 151500-1]UYZ62320.1 hypothetical protein OIS53_15135 [Hymenobacter sp. YIM 151500-1]
MFRLLFFAGLLAGLATAESAQAQNRRPAAPTQRSLTERVSPLPGVTLPTGASQRNADPLPVPTEVRPNGTLPQPKLPKGEVIVDSVQITPDPARRPASRRP